MTDHLGQSETSAAYWRGLFTIAEDALREIAKPECMIVREANGDSWIDTGVPASMATGALRRIQEMRSS